MKWAAIESVITVTGISSRDSSHAVRRAPCRSGRVSHAITFTVLPAFTAERITPSAVPHDEQARAPALQWVRTVQALRQQRGTVFSDGVTTGSILKKNLLCYHERLLLCTCHIRCLLNRIQHTVYTPPEVDRSRTGGPEKLCIAMQHLRETVPWSFFCRAMLQGQPRRLPRRPAPVHPGSRADCIAVASLPDAPALDDPFLVREQGLVDVTDASGLFVPPEGKGTVHADRNLTASRYARMAADPPEATLSGISLGATAVPAT